MIHKLKIKILILFTFLSAYINAQQANGGEIFLSNYSSTNIKIMVYPVSMTFNNDWDENSHTSYRNYNLLTGDPGLYSPRRDYINARNTGGGESWISMNQSEDKVWEFDWAGGSAEQTRGTIAFGIYKFEFYWDPNKDPDLDPPDDYFTLEYDEG